VVLTLEQDDRRLVGSCRCRQLAGPRHEDEPRHGPAVVADVLPQDGEPVVGRGNRRADGGLVYRSLTCQPRGSSRCGCPRQVFRVREVRPHPGAHLGPCVRMGGHRANVGERDTGWRGQDEGDRDDLFADHDERVAAGQGVQRGTDPALDGVLDRHHRGVEITGPQCCERGVDGGERDPIGSTGPGSREALTKCHLGECACGTKESVALAHEPPFPVRAAASACCSSGDSVTSLSPSTMPLA